MPFIGTQPEIGGYSVLDALTASATASYTLQLNSVNFSPASANQLLVSLNGVIQKPGSSFTVSGSTLTFSSALTSNDSIDFILAMGEPLLIGTPSDGTVSTAKIATDAVSSAKIADNAVGTDALDLTANYTFTGTIAGVKGPAFKARKSSAQNSVGSNASTKVTFETEEYDTDSDYDTSNSRFTPSRAGYYLITSELQASHAVDECRVMGMIYKNGSIVAEGNCSHGNDNGQFPASRSTWLVPMNGSSDYIEIYSYGSNAGSAYNFAYTNVYRCTIEGQWVRDL